MHNGALPSQDGTRAVPGVTGRLAGPIAATGGACSSFNVEHSP